MLGQNLMKFHKKKILKVLFLHVISLLSQVVFGRLKLNEQG